MFFFFLVFVVAVFFFSMFAFSLKRCASSMHTGDFRIICHVYVYWPEICFKPWDLENLEILQKLQILEITKILIIEWQHWSQIVP